MLINVLVSKKGRKTYVLLAQFPRLFEANDQNHIHFRHMEVIEWHDIFSLWHHFLASWNLYTVSPVLQGQRANAHLLAKFNASTSQKLLIWNPIPELTIVLIWKTPACLKCGKKIFHKEDSWVWAVNNACSHPPNLLVFLCELWHNAFW